MSPISAVKVFITEVVVGSKMKLFVNLVGVFSADMGNLDVGWFIWGP